MRAEVHIRESMSNPFQDGLWSHPPHPVCTRSSTGHTVKPVILSQDEAVRQP